MGCGGSRAMPVDPQHREGTDDSDSDEREDMPSQADLNIEMALARSRSKDVSDGKGSVAASTDGIVAAALRQKRKAGVVIFGASGVDESAAAEPLPNIPKPNEIRDIILQALHDNVFFADLGEAEMSALVDAMSPREVTAGETVIQQGDIGDNFYVIESGRFEIIVNEKKVVEWGEHTKNRSFGELALLYNLPRAATVRSVSESRLWCIDRHTFRRIMADASHAQHNRLTAALRKGVFEELTEAQRDSVAAVATVVKYKKGDRIVTKDEEGEVFFIIESGSVICRNLPGEQCNNLLTAGDYFGERAILKGERRCCDVEAESDVSMIALHREDFETHLGNLREMFEYNMGMRLLLCMPLINSLADDTKTDVFGQLSVASYANGAVIAAQGKKVDSFFIVKDAQVAIRHSTRAPDRSITHQEIGVLQPGHWFPDDEIDNDTALPCSFVAKGEVQVFVLDKASYMRFIQPAKKALLASGRIHNSHLHTLVTVANTPRSGIMNGSNDSVLLAGRGGAGAMPSSQSSASSRPKEARRFSTDYKIAPTAAVNSGVPLPSSRKRLGIPLNELELKATVGTGTFGRVKLVYHRKTNQSYALKILQKNQIVALKQQTNIMNERDILFRCDHPFIIRLYDTYKDRDRLYMLLEIVQGGELFSRLQNSDTPGRVSADVARFYAACVLDAFEYLHSFHVIYRDLKPENLLIDKDGYLKLVDFGFAKIVRDKTYTLCGTPEYLAPELVLGRGHDKAVDIWALGILLFEQVAGFSPFADRAHNDQMVICKNILRGTVDFPSHFRDRDLQHLVLQLLVKDIPKRLGCGKRGEAEIKEHAFFKAIDWERLRRKELRAPWKPKVANNLDTSHFDDYDDDDRIDRYKDDGSAWESAF